MSAPEDVGGEHLAPSLDAVFELSQHTSDALLLVDESLRIRFFGGAAQEIFGYQENEILGRPLDVLLPIPQRAMHERFISEFNSSSEAVRPMNDRRQVSGLTATGTVIPLEVTIAKVSVRGSTYFGAIIRDVSERIAAMERLEEIAESRMRLIASVSHELRTPLTGVLGYADLLENRSLPQSEVSEVAGTIAREASDLAAIIEDLIVAARLELEEIRLEVMDVELLREAQSMHDALVPPGKSGIHVTGEPVTVVGDPIRVRQILRNLLVNAMRHGGPQVAIGVYTDGTAGVVRVIDDGPGPPEQTAETMFEAFSSGHHRDGAPGSLGLGLSISRRLARAMGGDVWFERDGDHTVFALALPLATGA